MVHLECNCAKIWHRAERLKKITEFFVKAIYKRPPFPNFRLIFYYIKKFISNQGPLHLKDEEDTWKPTRLCQFSEYNCIFWQLHTDLVHGFNKLLGLVHTAKQFKMGQSQYLAISADRGNPLY